MNNWGTEIYVRRTRQGETGRQRKKTTRNAKNIGPRENMSVLIGLSRKNSVWRDCKSLDFFFYFAWLAPHIVP